jgi:hypothetical protein
MSAKIVGSTIAFHAVNTANVVAEYTVLGAEATAEGTKSFWEGLKDGFQRAQDEALNRKVSRVVNEIDAL